MFAPVGPGALAEALAAAAARAFGAEIRTDAEVVRRRHRRRPGRATGVVLAGGEEVPARAVVSAADPKRTLLGMVDPEVLGPDPGVAESEPSHARVHGQGEPARCRGSRASPACRRTTNGSAAGS